MSIPEAQPQGRERFRRSGYEKRDVHAAWIFGVVGFLIVAGLIMHFCLAGVLERLKEKPAPRDAWTGVRLKAGSPAANEAVPHLQISPPADLKQFREREEAELTNYGWINRTAGVVRVPIDRAMELVLQRGLPVRTGTNAQTGPSSLELQQQRPAQQQPQEQK
jgi:hypothetical protein